MTCCQVPTKFSACPASAEIGESSEIVFNAVDTTPENLDVVLDLSKRDGFIKGNASIVLLCESVMSCSMSCSFGYQY